MAAKLFLNLLRRKRVSSRNRKTAGFTILELLISMIVAGLVIVVLLNLVIDLLQTDRREYARTETQREMQMAMDFMVNDIREATYVYNNDELNVGRPDGIPPLRQFVPIPDQYEPILAFWKPEQIEDDKLPSPSSCSLPAPANPPLDWTRCRILLTRRRMFTLVVYLQKINQANESQKWKGISRIMRYQLRQYDLSGSGRISVMNQNQGYVEPLTNNVEFSIWPYARSGTGSSTNMQAGIPPATDLDRPVLVDFVDHPTSSRVSPNHRDSLPPPADPRNECPVSQYSRIPPEGNRSGFDNPSFVACISTATSGSSSANQDVIVFLRGNPTGKAGVKIAPLLSIKTQAVARGVIDKTPPGN